MNSIIHITHLGSECLVIINQKKQQQQKNRPTLGSFCSHHRSQWASVVSSQSVGQSSPVPLQSIDSLAALHLVMDRRALHWYCYPNSKKKILV